MSSNDVRFIHASARTVALAACALFAGALASRESEGAADMTTLALKSSAFENEKEIPVKYTCDGEGVSPPLSWSGAPAGTKSLALIVDDPDAPDPSAPKITFVHWVVYDIPPNASALPENVSSSGLPSGAREGINEKRAVGYTPPCPPIGRHRYFHKLYALDTTLGDRGKADKAAIENAMKGHVLGQTALMGTYAKKKPSPASE